MASVIQRVTGHIRVRALMHPGDRVAAAVSGGADSVALLRILLEVRADLGLVLSVAHFHHGIRGAEADEDEAFVAQFARDHQLELHLGSGDARAYASKHKISLETAARALRLNFFTSLLDSGRLNRIATAHTLDDQAETVLMKVLRGAGTRGLSGIFPEQRLATGSIVRPLLELRREELREYLRGVNQSWREDASNADVSFTRNRVRARVLPLLHEEINPSVDQALARLGELARGEEEYWAEQVKRLLPLIVAAGEPARGGGRKQTSAPAVALDLQKLQQQPLAVRRRLLRAAAEQIGCNLDFEHVHAILDLLSARTTRGRERKTIEIQSGWRARLLFRELRIEGSPSAGPGKSYHYSLPMPGESRIPELNATICARISEDNGAVNNPAYNRAHSIELSPTTELVVRNWRPGDRFQPARHTSEKRVKQLLCGLHLGDDEKQLWPVVVAKDRLVWVRGIESPELRTTAGQRILIEESED
ncbi:MAG TPA: tRNA lysidine(34) synthetase TilS [Terriglobales bacterium]|nr:tRNA lysidine(34) synthetase TilS [Terriglobales bacterium]